MCGPGFGPKAGAQAQSITGPSLSPRWQEAEARAFGTDFIKKILDLLILLILL